MRRRMKSVLSVLGAFVLIPSMTAVSAFGGTWNEEGGGWRYYQDGNRPAGKGWVQEGGSFYATDENGIMRTGWYQDLDDGGRWYYLDPQQGGPQGAMKTGWVMDNGRWYFLDTRIGGPRGGLLTGWQWIDGKCYYLDPAQGGAAVTSGATPDGFTVDANGAWTDTDGNPYYEAGRGISSTVAAEIGGGGAFSGAGMSGTSGGSGGNGGSGGAVITFGNGNIYDDDAWNDYSDGSVGYSANDFKTGNYGMMDSDERVNMEDAIDDFKGQYITSGMSDFEKEIMIIRWLVENCTYEKGENWENSTAYSCIVNGEAQCAGYADAFLQTAKACGLDARYVNNSDHAWNLVKIGGDWYHVDVTWEDPVGSNSYGFSNLRNMYINLEDSQIRGVLYHHTWSPSTIKAKGTDYGTKVVAQYLKDGTVDTSKGESYSQQMEEFFDKVKNEDGSNMITYSSEDATADRITSYLESVIDARNSSAEFVVRYPSDYSAGTTGVYSKLAKINDKIEDSVNRRIDSKYAGVLTSDLKLSLFLEIDADNRYYTHVQRYLRYQSGQGKQVAYTVHFIDEGGNEVGTQSGTTEKNKEIELVIPAGYKKTGKAKSNCQMNQGEAYYGGSYIRITGSETVDMNVKVKAEEVEIEKPEVASPGNAEKYAENVVK